MPDTTLTSLPMFINLYSQITITASSGNGFGANLLDSTTPYLTSFINQPDTLTVFVLCYITIPENSDNTYNVSTDMFSAQPYSINLAGVNLNGICMTTSYPTDSNSKLWYLEFSVMGGEGNQQFVEFFISDPSGNPGRGSISIPKSGIGDPE